MKEDPPEADDLVRRYNNLLKGPRSNGALESTGDGASPDLRGTAILQRLDIAREHINRMIENYLANDPELKRLAEQILQEGGEALRVLGQQDGEGLLSLPRQAASLEVIARTDGSRPSFLVRNGEVDLNSSPAGDWTDAIYLAGRSLKRALACVGRIDVDGKQRGTGFLLSRDLVATNRHVLDLIAKGNNTTGWVIDPKAVIDFGHEYESIAVARPRRLRDVIFTMAAELSSDIVHTELDLALIRLEPVEKPLFAEGWPLSIRIHTTPPTMGQTLFVIGYAAEPSTDNEKQGLLDQLFKRQFGYKRLAPGKVVAHRPGFPVSGIAYDATTLGGNSGSLVLEYGAEQDALGLHYGGSNLKPRQNWAHLLPAVLDRTDGVQTRTLRECLHENNVYFY